MDKRIFNANKKLIAQEIETFLKELQSNCNSPYQLRYLANNYLSLAIEDIKRVIREVEENE